MEATINQEYVLHEKRVKELSRQAFARAHKNATVVDLEEQLPEDCTYKGEVACMGDLPDNPSVGDFYSVKNLDGKVKTVYFAHGWKELGREV